MKQVLILCTGNSCRSILAEALINHTMSDRWKAYSAGVSPSVINPRAVTVLTEIGVSTDGYYSKSIDEVMRHAPFDVVITVCDHARERCPVLPGASILHCGFDDPAEYSHLSDEIALPEFRRVRDEIRERLLPLLDTL